MVDAHDLTAHPVDCPECQRMVKAGEPDSVLEHSGLEQYTKPMTRRGLDRIMGDQPFSSGLRRQRAEQQIRQVRDEG